MVRDTSQILTPLQGLTSALTNSNFKVNTAIVNSNSSGDNYHPREDIGAKKYGDNILIANHIDTSMLGPLKMTNMETSRDNLMNTAMIASLTQRSHNLAGGALTNTEENDA